MKKLNQLQQRRIDANHKKKLINTNVDTHPNDWVETNLDALVITRFGTQVDVELENKDVIRCHIRRTLNNLVTGDKVKINISKDNTGIIDALLPRSSELTRPDKYDGVKLIAANIDQILVVSSILPAFNSHIIDRYIVAAEASNIKPILIVNKDDLLITEKELILNTCNIYRNIGYQVLLTSINNPDSIASLKKILENKTSVFVGQSGVGKSSLINKLCDASLTTNEVSNNSGLGQHTTTATKLLHLDNKGIVIDSPGVREFALWHLDTEQIIDGFVELKNLAGNCKYRDCKHDELTPQCALHAGVAKGDISKGRFDSYQKIMESLADPSIRHAKFIKS